MAANYSEKVSKSTPSAAMETVSLLIRLDVDINLREGELRKQSRAAGGGEGWCQNAGCDLPNSSCADCRAHCRPVAVTHVAPHIGTMATLEVLRYN